MKLLVNPHKIEIDKSPVNEREIDITKCEFEFANEITNDYVKEAYFTFNGTSYKQIIVNNECDIPSEVLEEKGQVEIGVVAFLIENNEEIKRYNPSPAYFNTWVGSLKDNAENSEPITPSDKEQIESIVNNAVNEINTAIDNVETAVNEANNLDIDIVKQGKIATITLNKKDNTTKTVTLSDGTSLMFNWNGTSLGIKTEKEESYTYVDLQGRGITNIELISSEDNIDTYQINYTDGATSTFTVTNSEVTNEEFNNLTNEVNKYKTIYNVLPKVSGEGTDIELEDTGNAMLVFNSFNGDTEQDSTSIDDGDEHDSPSPDYPQDIKVVTGEQKINISGKNLFNKETVTENVLVSRNTGEFATNKKYATSDYIRVNANTVYYQSNTDNYYSVLYDLNKKFYGIVGTKKFTPQIDGYIRTSFFKTNIDLVQVEIGEVATTYTPYQSQTYPLSLGDIELAGINNYTDYIFKNETTNPFYNSTLEINKWYLHKEIRKINLSENQNWYAYNKTIGGISRKIFDSYTSLSSNPTTTKIFSSHFKNVGNTPTGNYQISYNPARYYKIDITYFEMETVDDFKEWLSNNQVLLYVINATPTNTKITNETLIEQLENINKNAHSYKDTTIITCSSKNEDNETLQTSTVALKDISTLFEQVNNAIIEIGGGE